jgi:hypothetical protein
MMAGIGDAVVRLPTFSPQEINRIRSIVISVHHEFTTDYSSISYLEPSFVPFPRPPRWVSIATIRSMAKQVASATVLANMRENVHDPTCTPYFSTLRTRLFTCCQISNLPHLSFAPPLYIELWRLHGITFGNQVSFSTLCDATDQWQHKPCLQVGVGVLHPKDLGILCVHAP